MQKHIEKNQNVVYKSHTKYTQLSLVQVDTKYGKNGRNKMHYNNNALKEIERYTKKASQSGRKAIIPHRLKNPN